MRINSRIILAFLFGVFVLTWPAYLFGSLHNPFSPAGTAHPGTSDKVHQTIPYETAELSRNAAHPSPSPPRPLGSPPRHPPRHITVVNCVPYHLEVLIGIVDLAKSSGHRVTVYAHLRASQAGHNVAAGLQLLKARLGDFPTHSCDVLPLSSHAPPPRTDLAIYASASEDAYGHRETFIASMLRLNPKRVAAVIHNTQLPETIQAVMTSHHQVFLLALAKRSYQRLFVTTKALADRSALPQPSCSWIVPFSALPPPAAAAAAAAATCQQPSAPCHAHFTVQGNLEHHRRDYQGLFQDLAGGRKELLAQGVQVKLVGAAPLETADTLVPGNLRQLVEVHANYNYTSFYAELQSSIALVPLLASPQYLDGTRITSTLLASLATGVPILADAAFASTYSFLPPSAYYLQRRGESLARAMLRVAAMGPKEHAAVRASLREGADGLRWHNSDMLLQVLRGV